MNITAVTVVLMKVLATMVGIVILGVKVMGVFVHTENVVMINVKATSYEGAFESSLQLNFLLLCMFG